MSLKVLFLKNIEKINPCLHMFPTLLTLSRLVGRGHPQSSSASPPGSEDRRAALGPRDSLPTSPPASRLYPDLLLQEEKEEEQPTRETVLAPSPTLWSLPPYTKGRTKGQALSHQIWSFQSQPGKESTLRPAHKAPDSGRALATPETTCRTHGATARRGSPGS